MSAPTTQWQDRIAEQLLPQLLVVCEISIAVPQCDPAFGSPPPSPYWMRKVGGQDVESTAATPPDDRIRAPVAAG